ncbi:hypothetical protein OsI_33334 [Oryza sativa Indica Group]|uniref:Uncharacterized protein n=1 Tax=Oryza sativa subsp. indica TaxID=39946 RepID=A2Z6Q4_ORYSI|nr:hypothetical protein OsI_33334 [Oryza sativa Indica Group]
MALEWGVAMRWRWRRRLRQIREVIFPLLDDLDAGEQEAAVRKALEHANKVVSSVQQRTVACLRHSAQSSHSAASTLTANCFFPSYGLPPPLPISPLVVAIAEDEGLRMKPWSSDWEEGEGRNK